jgi:glycosyltransferase involved in cell wall biosynthesis
MGKKRILLWAPFGAGEHYWGPGISAYRLYDQELADEYELYLAHGYSDQKHYSRFKDVFRISTLDKNVASQLTFLIKSYLWIRRNAHRFDVVHCLGIYEMCFRPALWFEKRGVPAFCKITGDTGGLTRHSIVSELLGVSKNRKQNLNKLSGYIAISNEICESLKRLGVKDKLIFRIPNGVNEDLFKPVDIEEKKRLRLKYGLEDKFTIIFVGGISARKQPMWLVRSFHDVLQKTGRNLQLVLLGPDRSAGQELRSILTYVKENGLESSVFHFEHSDKPVEFYQLSDVFCLPSKSEGMSNALLEAMACGIPCIVTPISGSVDLISEGENGFFINNIEDLSERLFSLFQDIELTKKLGKSARRIVSERYSSKSVLSQHFDIFRQTFH